MKKIGIIAAMYEEAREIEKMMIDIQINIKYDLKFIEGNIKNREVVLVQCGVGKVNAARTTQILIDKYDISEIINVGSAGAGSNDVTIGDIVIGKELVQHDFNITAFGHERGYITDLGKKIEGDPILIEKMANVIKELSKEDFKIKIGNIASGDIFCTEPKMKEKIFSYTNADAIEMEGAAIAQVAYLDKIPCVVIRSISDDPNGDNHITFEEFLELASKRCAKIIEKYCENH